MQSKDTVESVPLVHVCLLILGDNRTFEGDSHWCFHGLLQTLHSAIGGICEYLDSVNGIQIGCMQGIITEGK